MRLHADVKIEVQFHRIAFAGGQFSIGSIAALAAFSAEKKKLALREGTQSRCRREQERSQGEQGLCHKKDRWLYRGCRGSRGKALRIQRPRPRGQESHS